MVCTPTAAALMVGMVNKCERKSFRNLHSVITILNVPGGQKNRGAWVGLDGAKGGRGGQRCGRWVNKSKVQNSSVENYSNIAVLLFDEKDSKVVTLVTSESPAHKVAGREPKEKF